jgi:DNA-binding ferritin-like protein
MEIEIIKLPSNIGTLEFAEYLNKFLSNVKLLHWYTLNYDIHKILNDLYDELSEHFDKLQEEIIGLDRKKTRDFPNINLKNLKISNIDIETQLSNDIHIMQCYKVISSEFKNIICGLDISSYISNSQSGLNNTKEDILSEINKSLYLLDMVSL